MCVHYILVNDLEQIENRYELPPQSVCLGTGSLVTTGVYAPVINSEKPKEIQLYKFGLTPFWAKKEMLLLNARSEGDSNTDDKPDFKGSKGIILKPAFRKPIRSQRCIVLASAFIACNTTSAFPKPYLVYLRNHQSPFAIAGICDSWTNPETGETINSFGIITTAANSLLRKTGSSRMPVILTVSESKKWINPETELSQVTRLMKRYDSKLMNAYPVSPKILSSAGIDKTSLKPVGDKLLTENDTPLSTKITGQGYHRSKKTLKGDTNAPSMAERAAGSANQA